MNRTARNWLIALAVVLAIVVIFVLITILDHVSGAFDERNSVGMAGVLPLLRG